MISIEKSLAEKLLESKSIKLNVENPFTWASGWKSPIYCDNRKSLSFPDIRDMIKTAMCNLIKDKFPDCEALAGVATAGIAWGALAADQLKLPFLYVRPKPKEHGMGNQIEGNCQADQKILVIEDLISTGKSSLQVCDVLKASGVDVIGMVSIFTYGFNEADRAFKKAGIPLYSLTNYETLITLAVERGIVSEDQQSTLLNWRMNPAEWNK